jgi:hypothetical protein
MLTARAGGLDLRLRAAGQAFGPATSYVAGPVHILTAPEAVVGEVGGRVAPVLAPLKTFG